MTKGELKFMEVLIPDYYKHIKANPKSLLARVYGIYTVKMQGLKDIHLILMGNTLRWQNRADISRVYDLKGSTYSRHVKSEQSHKATVTLKDVNFIENLRELQEINLSRRQARELIETINSDTEMLCRHGIMDYSMLLGIENKFRVSDSSGFEKSESGRRQTKRSKLPDSELKRIARHLFTSPDGSQIFHFSIIDFL
jgi:1-phosphatidylinositol-4-phosphate 5-kinase